MSRSNIMNQLKLANHSAFHDTSRAMKLAAAFEYCFEVVAALDKSNRQWLYDNHPEVILLAEKFGKSDPVLWSDSGVNKSGPINVDDLPVFDVSSIAIRPS